MRIKLIALITLLMSFTASAAYAPLAPSLTVGGRVFTDLTNLIVLQCYVSLNNGCTFRKTNASSGYQVTAGKTLTIWAYRLETANTASISNGIPYYADADIGFSSGTAPTSPVYIAGGAASTIWASTALAAQATSTPGMKEVATEFPIPATKYAAWNWSAQNGSLMVTAFGYEN